MSRQFQAAVKKLIDDEQYRRRVANNPQRIVSDFELTGADLRMLMSIGGAGGPVRARMAGGCSSSCCRGENAARTALT